MNVYEAIKTMLAVRDYRDEHIPGDVIARILEAARLTGSSRNDQEWDFIVISDRDRLRRLASLARTGGYMANAPLAIAVVVPDDPTGHIDGARATQDMMLAAWGEGVGSNWVGNMNTPEVRDLLNIPDDHIILNIIPFGYPRKDVGAGIKNRKPLHEIVHKEAYGKPFGRVGDM